jgi:hypothetical protein
VGQHFLSLAQEAKSSYFYGLARKIDNSATATTYDMSDSESSASDLLFEDSDNTDDTDNTDPETTTTVTSKPA